MRSGEIVAAVVTTWCVSQLQCVLGGGRTRALRPASSDSTMFCIQVVPHFGKVQITMSAPPAASASPAAQLVQQARLRKRRVRHALLPAAAVAVA